MIAEKRISSEKDELIEHIGVHFEKVEKLAPVASWIYASILLTCREGITFEQLVQDMNASKSTVCTHLNTLENNGQIEYFTKPGDRKRYYIPASNAFLNFINEKIERCESECQIQEEILQYKKGVNEARRGRQDKQCNLQYHQNILVFLKESVVSFKRLKSSLTQK